MVGVVLTEIIKTPGPISSIGADIDSSPFIGLPSSSKLKLVKRVTKSKEEWNEVPEQLLNVSNCFGGVGCVKDSCDM